MDFKARVGNLGAGPMERLVVSDRVAPPPQNDITPLHVASKRGNANMVLLLLERHAAIHARTKVPLRNSLTASDLRPLTLTSGLVLVGWTDAAALRRPQRPRTGCGAATAARSPHHLQDQGDCFLLPVPVLCCVSIQGL